MYLQYVNMYLQKYPCSDDAPDTKLLKVKFAKNISRKVRSRLMCIFIAFNVKF